ncbi:MAG: divalent-cation tolerance protein CutA [Halobacteria archaeon]|nr:divalent-cation tolerance protein CutA [Halobacteria archaeon]
MTEFTRVHTTVGSEEEAREVARRLVEEGLAACVNIHGVESVYRWEGEVVEEEEAALDIKTARGYDEVRGRIEELHPYDVPAVLEYGVERANDEYEEWVEEVSAKNR